MSSGVSGLAGLENRMAGFTVAGQRRTFTGLPPHFFVRAQFWKKLNATTNLDFLFDYSVSSALILANLQLAAYIRIGKGGHLVEQSHGRSDHRHSQRRPGAFT